MMHCGAANDRMRRLAQEVIAQQIDEAFACSQMYWTVSEIADTDPGECIKLRNWGFEALQISDAFERHADDANRRRLREITRSFASALLDGALPPQWTDDGSVHAQ
jgi:hypothetical protein